MMPPLRTVIVAFLLTLLSFSFAATRSLRFKHFTTEQGLSASAVTCIAQDRNGYMWFGTYDGLNKFDGYEFQTYRNKSNESRSLSSNAVLALFEDRRERFWIGTQTGLDLYERATDSFTHFGDPGGVALTAVDIAETPSGEIIFLATDRVYTVRFADSTCVLYKPQTLAPFLRGFSGWRRMVWDREGLLWLLMEANGLAVFDPNTNGIKHYTALQREAHGLGTDRIIDLVEDRTGRLWIATKDGLYFFDKDTERFARAENILPQNRNLSNDNCYSLFLDVDDNLWIGTSQGGLNLLPHDRSGFQHILHDPQDSFGLNNNSIQTLFVDRQKNLWVGTLKGLNFAQNESKSFHTFRHEPNREHTLSDNAAAAFGETREGNLWVATDGGGLNFFERNTAQFSSFRYEPKNPSSLRSDAILTVYEDSRGVLWAGGFLAGLSRFNPARKNFTHVLHSKAGILPLNNDDVRHIHEDRSGDIWIATNGDGVFHFRGGDPMKHEQYVTNLQDIEHSLRTNYCLIVFEDSARRLWVGTYKGLSCFDREKNSWRNYTSDGPDSSGLSNNWIYALCEDRANRLWVGTARGLNLLDETRGTFRGFGTRAGLPGEIINGIVEDQQGYLWISTNNGLAKFNATEALANERASNAVVVYTEHDGLQGAEYIHGAVAKLSTGELVFGGTNGLSIFQPEQIRANVKFPPVALTKLRILDQLVQGADTPQPYERNLSEAEALTLTYAQAQIFTLFFSALEYSAPEKIKYRYLLEGYHDNWIEIGSNRSATFMKLNSGDYSFRVTATNSEGAWSERSATLRLKILPPWWQTWYAYLAYAASVVLLAWAYHRYSVKLMHLKMDLQSQKLETEKTHELEALKSRFFTNISHEFRTPLTLILVPLREMIKHGRDKSWPQLLEQFRLMQRSAERMLRLVNQVIDFNKIEAGKLDLNRKEIDAVQFTKEIVETFTPMAADKHLTLEFGSNCVTCYAEVDPDKLDVVIFNLLSNAFKFTPEHGEISVNVKQLAEKILEISVKDSGPGVPTEHVEHIFDRFYHVDHPFAQARQGAGIGLSLSKELVELHRGEILVQNQNGKGACFLVRLPLGATPIHDHHAEHAVQSALANSTESVSEFTLLEAHLPAAPTLLIVEDDGDLRDYLRLELKEEYHVLVAADGQRGVQLALETLPDLILSDIMMFELDGIELCKQLKSHQLTSHIPIVLLTARTAEDQQLEGLETGADDYITKPFNLEILKTRLRNLLESRRMLRERFGREILAKPHAVFKESAEDEFLARAISLVETRLSDSAFDVQAFSQEMGMSRAQLFRKLKAVTSERPLEFIQTIRLQRAAHLLLETQMNVTEICFEVGFNYPSHFAKLFHAKFGRSPKEYRKEVQEYSPFEQG